jgi:hypothetical protein
MLAAIEWWKWVTAGAALLFAGVLPLVIQTAGRLKFTIGGTEITLGPQLERAVDEIRRETTAPKDSDAEEREYILLREYHAQGLGQAKVSFRFSMIFATLGFGLIVYAVVADSVGIYQGSSSIPLVAGAIVEAIGGLFFVQSNRAQSQMREFFDRLRLDRRLAESLRIADSIPDPTLESRLKVVLALELSGNKPTDQQVAALVATREEFKLAASPDTHG